MLKRPLRNGRLEYEFNFIGNNFIDYSNKDIS